MQRIPFLLLTQDGEPLVNQTRNITVKLSVDGGDLTEAICTITETGSGWYYTDLTDSELNCVFYTLIHIICEGAQPVVKNWTPETGDVSSITAKDVWEYEPRTLTHNSPDIPSEETGVVYCTRSDVERRWGKLNVTVMADIDNDGNETTITEQINTAIINATNRINSELASSIYVIPFSPVPHIVTLHAAALAGVELYRIRSVAVSNDSALFTAAETEFSNWVIAVYNGRQILGAREVPI